MLIAMDFRIIILSIIIMILLGVLLKKIDLLKEEDVETLNNLVINICLPCLIFNALYTADVSLLPSLSILTLSTSLTSLIVGVFTYIILKLFAWDNVKIWSILVTVVLGNTGFLGYPITQGIYGSEGLIRAVFCDCSTSITFVILSVILILIFDGELKVALRKIATFVPLWSIVLGILFNIFAIPITDVGTTVVGYLGDATIPLIMISLGLSLNISGLKNNLKEVSLASFIKLILYPFVALGVMALLGVTGFNHTIGLIESAMSSAMIGLVLAITYKLDAHLTSDCIFTSTLFGLVTIPLFLMFIV